VKLPTGKMSSRTGDVITGEWLLEEAKKQFLEKYPDMSDETVEKVAIAAIKYAFLKNGVGGDITFSFEESIDLHGNSGPYLQYTTARTQSVLARVKGEGESVKKTLPVTLHALPLNSEEELLLRALIHFPEVL